MASVLKLKCWCIGTAALTALVFLSIAVAQAQVNQLRPLDFGTNSASGPEVGEKLKASAYFTAAQNEKPAMLYVTAELSPGWHTYSLTQPAGGPNKSRIKLTPSADYKIASEFQPQPAPAVHYYEDIWPGLAVEEHEGHVTWSAPLDIAAGVNPAKLEISGAVYAQVCAKDCLPPTDYKFVAQLASGKEATADNAPQPGVAHYRPSFSHVALSGVVDPANAKPDSVVRLVITAEPAAGWHIYALAEKDPQDVSKPTLIVLTQSSGFRFRSARPSVPPVEKTTTVNQSGKVAYHDQPVSWTIDLEIPPDAKPGQYPVAGIVGFQTCEETACDAPKAAWFDGQITVGSAAAGGTATASPASTSATGSPLLFRDAKYGEAAKLAEQATNQPVATPPKPSSGASSFAPASPAGSVAVEGSAAPDEADTGKSLAAVLISAFLGGIILNLMPCVLPVIGLKLLTFVEQSHQHRSRVFMLNVWYTLGLLSVFLVLATLACGASLGLRSENLSWGQQFSSTAFNIVMSGIVFVMALSFLGVWEIPIPGFVGSGKAAEAATHEGAPGAFAKGVVSTVLATPCSGPLLGPVFGFTLQQSPAVIYAIFASIGLGMASPYLVIGAFPWLIRFLPKPGAWMDTFKHVMGFVLLGTVVFLFTFLDRDYVVPTFGMLVGLWAACWWIGRTPLTAELGQKLKGWVQGGVIGVAVGYASFALLLPHMSLLPWQPFSTEALTKYRAAGKTVMVDFTADWCLTCKANLKFAIDTDDVRKVIQANNVVPLLADWTHESPEIKDTLAALKWNSIPVLAIFPADRPDKPIVLHDLITKSQLLEALEQAGPSQTAGDAKQTAMQ